MRKGSESRSVHRSTLFTTPTLEWRTLMCVQARARQHSRAQRLLSVEDAGHSLSHAPRALSRHACLVRPCFYHGRCSSISVIRSRQVRQNRTAAHPRHFAHALTTSRLPSQKRVSQEADFDTAGNATIARVGAGSNVPAMKTVDLSQGAMLSAVARDCLVTPK